MRTYNAPSYTAFCEPTVGETVWTFSFDDGYIDKAYVKAKYQGFDLTWTELLLPQRNITGNTATLPRGLLPCRALVIYRDTPKDKALCVYGAGGALLQDESREVAAKQSMHVIAELVDAGRIQHDDCVCGCAS